MPSHFTTNYRMTAGEYLILFRDTILSCSFRNLKVVSCFWKTPMPSSSFLSWWSIMAWQRLRASVELQWSTAISFSFLMKLKMFDFSFFRLGDIISRERIKAIVIIIEIIGQSLGTDCHGSLLQTFASWVGVWVLQLIVNVLELL